MKSKAAITLLAFVQAVIGFEWVRAGYEKVPITATAIRPMERRPGLRNANGDANSAVAKPALIIRDQNWC